MIEVEKNYASKGVAGAGLGLGIIVAYAAMGNFDKLQEIAEKLKAYAGKQ